MLIVLGILLWIVCGVIATFLNGLNDRISNYQGNYENESLQIFILGPLALLATTLLCLCSLVPTLSTPKILAKIYNLGRKREKK